MTIVSIKSGIVEGFRRIELSNGSFFSLNTCYLPSIFPDESLYSNGAEGKEINANEEAGFRFASSCLRTEKIALRLIARAEQCTFGLSRKLEKKGHELACINAVLSRLTELQLIDDQRFARLWLESRLYLARSPRKLLISLRGRGIDRKTAEAALKNALDEETELALLRRYAEKHKRVRKFTAQNSSESDIRSLKYYLKAEGFSFSVIQRFYDT